MVNQRAAVITKVSSLTDRMLKQSSFPPEYFQEIDYKKPTDLIIKQIKELISAGKLKPGDRLPSERVLTERFGVGRGYIREALRKLEFYGILKTLPQKGTIVASLGVKALEGLIANILHLESRDFESLMEVRLPLEVQAASLASQRATAHDLKELEQAHADFRQQVENGGSGLEEDHLFHLKIAETAQNSVLSSLIGLITPDIITQSRKNQPDNRFRSTLQEHEAILAAISARDREKAAASMRAHMRMAHKRRFERPV
jgi:GntR family transcriptional repressor for pyruvate dehydrogenase complex